MAHWAGLVGSTRERMAWKRAKFEEKKPMRQWEQLNIFNRPVNTKADVQRVFQKTQYGKKNTKCWRKRGCKNEHFQTIAARTVCWTDEISHGWKGDFKKTRKPSSSHHSSTSSDLFVPQTEKVKVNWTSKPSIQYCAQAPMYSCEKYITIVIRKVLNMSET